MRNIAESFALSHWLVDWPDDAPYAHILTMIEEGDENIEYVEMIEYEPPETIIRHIESTKHLFQQYAAQAIREARL